MRGERDWIQVMAGLAAVQLAVAYAAAMGIGFDARPRLLNHLGIVHLIVVILLLGHAVVLAVRLLARRVERPIAEAMRIIAAERERLLIVYVGLLLSAFSAMGMNWLKSMLPFAVPFWLDPALARSEIWLLGAPAWTWFDALLGPLSGVFRLAYQLWLPASLAAFIAVLHLRPGPLKSRLLIAYCVTWVIGSAAQYGFSSAGPLFYERLGFGDDYAALFARAQFREVALTSDYLWTNFQAGDSRVGGGISAMPSMHVAMTLWMAIAAATACPKLRWAGVAWLVTITLGSVLLGWHYLLDAPGGMLVAWAGWAIAGAWLRRERGSAELVAAA